MDEAEQILHQAWQRATTGPGAINAPAMVMLMARYKARQAVERELQAQGVRVNVGVRKIVRAANEYLRDHPELFEQAAEMIRDTPSLRKAAELEARRRACKANVLSDAQGRRR